MGAQEEALIINDNARRTLEGMVRDREREIKRLQEKEKNLEKLYKEEKEKNDKEIQEEKNKKNDERKEKIKKGGYEICWFYLKERCLKFDRCKYIHPPICYGTRCAEDCWMVHIKELDMEDERWAKRGAVPFKLEVPSRAGRKEICKFFERGDCTRGDKCHFRHVNEQQKQLRRPNLISKDLENIKEIRQQKDSEKNENLKKTEKEVLKRTTESTEDLQKLLDEMDSFLEPKNLKN